MKNFTAENYPQLEDMIKEITKTIKDNNLDDYHMVFIVDCNETVIEHEFSPESISFSHKFILRRNHEDEDLLTYQTGNHLVIVAELFGHGFVTDLMTSQDGYNSIQFGFTDKFKDIVRNTRKELKDE